MKKVLFQIEDAFSDLNTFTDIIEFLKLNYDIIVDRVQDATRDEWKSLDLDGMTTPENLNVVLLYKAGEHFPYDYHNEIIYVSYMEGYGA